MHVSSRALISAEDIQARVAELGEAISEHYDGRALTVVAVLKGACFFASDLLRCLTVPVQVEFIRARSYRGAQSSGVVEFSVLPECSMEGRNVLVIDDSLDTGTTAVAIVDRLMSERPQSLALCTLLDKPARRQRDVYADFVGFTIDAAFVVGYGLDYDEAYRNLPAIHVLEAAL